ncbi:MAG: hypothetical protein J6J06_06875 [Bacteroidaceae bacterium]|nr:hypothetical protein [Bacteroidaceae bacterium]
MRYSDKDTTKYPIYKQQHYPSNFNSTSQHSARSNKPTNNPLSALMPL